MTDYAKPKGGDPANPSVGFVSPGPETNEYWIPMPFTQRHIDALIGCVVFTRLNSDLSGNTAAAMTEAHDALVEASAVLAKAKDNDVTLPETEAALVYRTAVMTMERADMMPGVSMRELFDHYLQEARKT